ncbi:hypothetical protein GF322_05105 [Candidatus Dependentiae bacterium]|nr:hypothetical protein [Candidatus Dependentiae bacterium]
MRKKIIILFIVPILLTGSLCAVTNKTFFKPRPIGQDTILQNAMTNYYIHHIDSFGHFTISNNIFYEESTDSSDLARYFFPNNKTELVVKGLGNGVDADGNVTGADIAAEWLNIASNREPDDPYPNDNNNYTFSSKIKVSPKFKQFGTTFFLHKKISKYFFLSAYFPFVQVETNMRLQEYDKENERIPADVNRENLNTIHNAYEGFNNPLMKYGKIGNYWKHLAGLADIKFEAGANLKIKKNHQLDIFANVTIPTSHTPKAEYVFEPLIGNAGHWGLGCGLNLDLKLFKKLNFINKLDYLYLLQETEKRSFDLISNGPFSRYMLATNNKVSDRPIPLINYLTKDVDVTPGSSISWLASLHYAHRSFDFEIGYNFFYRQEEDVSLKHPWEEEIGIAVYLDNNLEAFLTSYNEVHPNYNQTSINSSIAVDAAAPFAVIEASNINVSSSKHPSVCTNKLYGTIGYRLNWNDNILGFNIGGSYEIASSNKLLSLWQIWFGTNLLI